MFWYGLLHTNNRVICMHHSKRYSKDLTHLTTFRISPALREQAERAAEWCGISFSDFVRQSITRNIFVSRSIEEEVTRKTAMVVMGYKEWLLALKERFYFFRSRTENAQTRTTTNTRTAADVVPWVRCRPKSESSKLCLLGNKTHEGKGKAQLGRGGPLHQGK